MIHRLRRGSPGLESLWEVRNPPERLHVEGSLEPLSLLPARGLAVVGTRHPTLRSVNRLRGWILDLRGSGLCIVSGLAVGIDRAAHLAAIEAGLPTVAVLGTGLGSRYPVDNSDLREAIVAAGGAVVSEFDDGEEPAARNFLQRNRLIAAWAQATWVVEAPVQSGALNTANWARQHERRCFATPCFPGDSSLLGNQGLIDDHAAIPFWGPHSLGVEWLELATLGRRGARRLTVIPAVSDDARQLAAMAVGGLPVQDLLDRSAAVSWHPPRFFAALREALQAGLLLDENGLVLKNPAISE
jgi:DNA protecting protein DprA